MRSGKWEELGYDGARREWGWDLEEGGREPEREREREEERNKWVLVGVLAWKEEVEGKEED